MPTFTYVCAKGHATDRTFGTDTKRTRTTRCAHPRCGRRASYSLTATHRGAVHVLPDIPEHYNLSLDLVVRGRRHLASLQRSLGCRDFEPSAAARERLSEMRERTLSRR